MITEEKTIKDKYEDCIEWLFDRFGFYGPVYRFLIDPVWKYKEWVKFPLQRLSRGYDDSDLWGVNTFITEKIRPALKAFVKNQKEYGAGCPADLFDNGKQAEGKECHKWIETLEKIELAFDLMWEDDRCTDEWFKKTTEQHIEDQKKIEEGLMLFAKYYQGLWD